jgi:hypothetical protein
MLLSWGESIRFDAEHGQQFGWQKAEPSGVTPLTVMGDPTLNHSPSSL